MKLPVVVFPRIHSEQGRLLLPYGASSNSQFLLGEKKVTGYLPFTPKRYISIYPRDKQERIWTIQKFVQYVKELEKIK